MPTESRISHAPLGWKIWLVVWTLPMLAAFTTIERYPLHSLWVWLSHGALVYLMAYRALWVLPGFAMIFAADVLVGVSSYLFAGANLETVLILAGKGLLFLVYLLFFKSARQWSEREAVTQR